MNTIQDHQGHDARTSQRRRGDTQKRKSIVVTSGNTMAKHGADISKQATGTRKKVAGSVAHWADPSEHF